MTRLKPRTAAQAILKAIKTFPAVVVTGPRQSGKTTLLKSMFSQSHAFVSLENPDKRLAAREDPLGFLGQYGPPVIIDEIQYVPELLSYVKTKIDEKRTPGRWLFTGSQHFALMEGVTQSLAGRAAVISLLPLSYSERINLGDRSKDMSAWLSHLGLGCNRTKKMSLGEILLRGSYPEIASRHKVDRQLWCASYITTYLERDVRNLANIGDLHQFEKFLRLCAARTGQILNLSEMARDLGISVPTAKRWLSILEASYQVYLLYPYYKNIGKRLLKSPKLYMTDTALTSYMMGIHDEETLRNGPCFGSLFETMVIADFLKRFLHFGQMPSLYYLRSRDGLEVDLVIDWGGGLHLFEIKSASTITPKHAVSLKHLKDQLLGQVKTAAVISCSPSNGTLGRGIAHYGWQNILES
ncbi:MAG: ATP-binding protein [Elusimicrobia bacterium]|nr:ATP-binding protein [Elusimicrobiota bacterium]